MRTCDCGCSNPRANSIPDLGGMWEIRCPECGATTGYTFHRKDAKERWEQGDVATFPDWLEEIANEGM